MSNLATVVQRSVLVDAIQWTSPGQGYDRASLRSRRSSFDMSAYLKVSPGSNHRDDPTGFSPSPLAPEGPPR